VPLLLVISQLVTAGVFALSAFGKLRAPGAFVASLADFGLLPARLHRPAGHALIAAETAVVPLVLVPALAPVGLGLAAVLLGLFAAVIVATLRRGRRPRCRCFGVASAPLGPAHVARNVVLAALAGAGAVTAAATAASWSLEPAPLAAGALIAAVALAVVAAFDDLVEVVAPHRRS
jgi:hypothetical protein